MFFLYLKFFYVSESLLLKAYFLRNTILNVVILFNFFKKILYKTNKPRWLKKVLVLTWASAKYKYIAIRRKV